MSRWSYTTLFKFALSFTFIMGYQIQAYASEIEPSVKRAKVQAEPLNEETNTNKEQVQLAPLERIPYHLIRIIDSHLDFKSSIALASINKRFRALVEECVLYRPLTYVLVHNGHERLEFGGLNPRMLKPYGRDLAYGVVVNAPMDLPEPSRTAHLQHLNVLSHAMRRDLMPYFQLVNVMFLADCNGLFDGDEEQCRDELASLLFDEICIITSNIGRRADDNLDITWCMHDVDFALAQSNYYRKRAEYYTSVHPVMEAYCALVADVIAMSYMLQGGRYASQRNCLVKSYKKFSDLMFQHAFLRADSLATEIAVLIAVSNVSSDGNYPFIPRCFGVEPRNEASCLLNMLCNLERAGRTPDYLINMLFLTKATLEHAHDSKFREIIWGRIGVPPRLSADMQLSILQLLSGTPLVSEQVLVKMLKIYFGDPVVSRSVHMKESYSAAELEVLKSKVDVIEDALTRLISFYKRKKEYDFYVLGKAQWVSEDAYYEKDINEMSPSALGNARREADELYTEARTTPLLGQAVECLVKFYTLNNRWEKLKEFYLNRLQENLQDGSRYLDLAQFYKNQGGDDRLVLFNYLEAIRLGCGAAALPAAQFVADRADRKLRKKTIHELSSASFLSVVKIDEEMQHRFLINLSRLCCKQNIEQAVAILEHVETRDSKGEMESLLGCLNLEQGKFDLGISNLERAAKKKCENAIAKLMKLANAGTPEAQEACLRLGIKWQEFAA
jgi:hypothetical protein